ncbi:SDR family oxidoreductase [Sphingomonas donggukensis]|uniref:SDR family oxidoreductase n=1 Tax=Sphingomonas donggukensis TaxID=2949093 RepID=A0ABY4TWA8_9SPHN|nr:SDR family oxidoreductase [Sphingomonas donggukensis]URW76667.1 SDR family oxidoreductase [Sphingomonas donggukensis]
MAGLALVTGGCRRVGAHIAARLAKAGYDIALHAGHDPQPEPWLVEALAGRRWHVFTADLSDAGQVAALPGDVVAHFGAPIDVLVNSASRFAAIDDGGVAMPDVMAHLSVNVAAPVALAQAVAEAAGTEGAAIVNILDQRVANPPRDQVVYTISKQALAEATRTLAIALAPRARVNGVAPGLVMPTGDYAEGQGDRLAALMPLERLASPQEVADAVAWLVGARSVTGQTIFVDGGAHLKSFERDFVHLAR